MVTDETIARLRRHAGFERSDLEELPSIAAQTYAARMSAALELAFEDYISALCNLYNEVNGDVPSEVSSKAESLPTRLVHAVHEVRRILEECVIRSNGRTDGEWFARAAWRADYAWGAVLAGDIDDIRQDMAFEEAARFP